MVIIGLTFIGSAIYLSTLHLRTGSLNFFDPIALIFVLGGLLGTIFISLDFEHLRLMVKSIIQLGRRSSSERAETRQTLINLFAHWNRGEKNYVLQIINDQSHPFIETTADALISQASPNNIRSRFDILRNQYTANQRSVIDAWELTAKTAPVFGMVGTIMGLFRMFQAFAIDSDLNLGSAMALALLTTLYGVLIGYGIAAPISSRLTFNLDKDLTLIDIAESSVLALHDGSLPEFFINNQTEGTRPKNTSTENMKD